MKEDVLELYGQDYIIGHYRIHNHNTSTKIITEKGMNNKNGIQ